MIASNFSIIFSREEPMSEEQGIKETKELLKFVIELGEGIDKAGADKKIDVMDVQYLIKPLASASAAFEGADKVKAELADLSAEEAAEIVKYAQDELQLSNEGIEKSIEAALKVGLEIYKYFKMFKKS